MLFPSPLVFSQEWGLVDFPLRASNEGLPRPRVARAQEINSPLFLSFPLDTAPNACLLIAVDRLSS